MCIEETYCCRIYGCLKSLILSAKIKQILFNSSSEIKLSFSNFFKKAEGHRIVVATFSSNIHRIQQIIDVAENLFALVSVLFMVFAAIYPEIFAASTFITIFKKKLSVIRSKRSMSALP